MLLQCVTRCVPDTLNACYGTFVKSVHSVLLSVFRLFSGEAKSFPSFLFSLLYMYYTSEISNPSGIVVVLCTDGHRGMLLLVGFFYCCEGRFVDLIFHMKGSHVGHTYCILTAHTQ